MKICGIIAEYNPFHLGHLRHIDYVKTTLNAEKVVVIMSGNFSQRGEPAVLNKFTRAKHAILSGADAVIELPSVFATANAEIFATGAVKILDQLNIVDGICFGAESGNCEDFTSLAKILVNETKDFKKTLKEKMESGISLAKAKFLTVKQLYGDKYDENLLNLPNNILGLEYTKAILKLNSKMQIYPMLREGDHNDKTLKKGVTSATSIRHYLSMNKKGKIRKNVPPYVYKDLTIPPFAFENMILSKIITTPAEQMKNILDCTEGLENRIKALLKDSLTLDELIEKVTTKRYTETRIRRILIANLLGISEKLVFNCLDEPLYAKVLAVNENSKDIISLMAKNSSIPILTRKSDDLTLKKTAQKCFEIDQIANDLYNLATRQKENEHQMLII